MADAGEARGVEKETPKWASATDSASLDVRAAAAGIITESQLGKDLGRLLNDFLNAHVPWPYHANPGIAFDATGGESQRFESLIYTSPTPLDRVSADNVACAVDVHERLDLEQLRQSFGRIARVKALSKKIFPSVSDGVPVADATMGIIFARESDVAIEVLAHEVAELLRKHPHRLWTDMVVVLSRGTVHLACQIPYKPLGDFLPPARNVNYRAAMYIHVFARAHAAFALNKMCALLFPYLYMYQPAVGLPPYKELLKDMPQTGMPIAGFQFNLSGNLVPVPTTTPFTELYLFPLSFRVEDQQGNLHAKVQYMPWQDGGVVRVQGQFPIEALLVFAGKEALSQPVVRFQGEQTSGVIPMSADQFKQMAMKLAKQSNLVIKPDQRPKLVINKHGDEGTSSPFIARLFLGLCTLRDQTIADKSLRQSFDKVFEGIIGGLQNLRTTARSITTLYSSHSEGVASGKAARVVNGDIYIDEPIDAELRRLTESFINTASRIVKERMKELVKLLDVNIGFLFQKGGAFNNGIARLRPTDPALGDYLIATRAKWCARLMMVRNSLEHETWSLPHVRHEQAGANARAIEPLIDGQPVTEFVAQMLDRVCCFVEELSTHAMQRRMQHDVSLTEIPLSERLPENAARFRQALIGGGTPTWALAYHDSKFEDT